MIPLVSVITATRNRSRMLLECVNSVRAQTVGDWEHLITDDGSTEIATSVMLVGVALRDGRVHTCLGKHLDRPAVHWNRMIGEARGKYVCILDDDNLQKPTFVEVMSGHLEAHPEVDMVTCGFVERAEDGTETENHANLETRERIAFGNTVDTSCLMIRREALVAIGMFSTVIRTNEDWEFVRRADERLTLAHLGEALVVYRRHSGQRMCRRDELGNAEDKLRIITGS